MCMCMWPTELSLYSQPLLLGPDAGLLIPLETLPSLLLTSWASSLGTLHLPTKLQAVPEERGEEGVLWPGPLLSPTD